MKIRRKIVTSCQSCPAYKNTLDITCCPLDKQVPIDLLTDTTPHECPLIDCGNSSKLYINLVTGCRNCDAAYMSCGCKTSPASQFIYYTVTVTCSLTGNSFEQNYTSTLGDIPENAVCKMCPLEDYEEL